MGKNGKRDVNISLPNEVRSTSVSLQFITVLIFMRSSNNQLLCSRINVLRQYGTDMVVKSKPTASTLDLIVWLCFSNSMAGGHFLL